MKSSSLLRLLMGSGAAVGALLAFGTSVLAAGPMVGSGPGADPDCFKPAASDTKFFQWPAKPGPYRIALDNGFIANDWRVQMIKTAKAYAAQPSVKGDIKEFKAISTGLDVAAQIAAANNFIDQGYDAVIVDAVTPNAWSSVIKKANEKGVVMLARVGATDIHPLAPVSELSLSRRQLVEIAKALARNPKVLILDEATSALTASDVTNVFAMLKQLRAEGLAIVYISHRMHEISELADDCTVYRNGQYVATFTAGTKTDDAIVEMMIGREYQSVFPPLPAGRRDVPAVLSLRDLSWAGELNGINLDVRPGEVVGLGGLDGQGQRQLLLALFGALIGTTGTVVVDGKPVKLSGPRHAKASEIGMALIPEDRKNEGLMLPMTVRENLSFAAIEGYSRFGIVDRKAEGAAIDEMVRLLQISSDGVDGPVAELSGGNQQKVVIGKWLMTKPRIILLNDPTRGIDVGTKQELYQLMRRLAADGAAILFYSTDYDELIGCCNRVLVLYGGTVVRELAGADLNERNLVSSALNLPLDDGGATQAAATEHSA